MVRPWFRQWFASKPNSANKTPTETNMRHPNSDNSITISTAGHGDPAKDYAGLRAALHRWEMKNGLRDAEGFLKTSHFNRRKKNTLMRIRTRTSSQRTAEMQSGAAISASPSSIFPLTLSLDAHDVLTVTETHEGHEYAIPFPEFLAQR